jgi:hypothetical protein
LLHLQPRFVDVVYQRDRRSIKTTRLTDEAGVSPEGFTQLFDDASRNFAFLSPSLEVGMLSDLFEEFIN